MIPLVTSIVRPPSRTTSHSDLESGLELKDTGSDGEVCLVQTAACDLRVSPVTWRCHHHNCTSTTATATAAATATTTDHPRADENAHDNSPNHRPMHSSSVV